MRFPYHHSLGEKGMTTYRLAAFLGLLLAFSIGVFTSAANAAADTGAIAGKTVDAEGKGVEGVAVSIYRPDTTKPLFSATTRADGRFAIDNVPAEKGFLVRAVVKKSILGVRGEKRDVAVQAGQTTDVGNIQLKIPTKKSK
jgi:hypothetical protein